MKRAVLSTDLHVSLPEKNLHKNTCNVLLMTDGSCSIYKQQLTSVAPDSITEDSPCFSLTFCKSFSFHQVILWGRTEKCLKETSEEISLSGTECHYFLCDVANREEVYKQAKVVREKVRRAVSYSERYSST